MNCPICTGDLYRPEGCIDLRCRSCERWWADPAATKTIGEIRDLADEPEEGCDRARELRARGDERLLAVHLEHCRYC